MIPFVYAWVLDRWETFVENYQPLRDTIDILVVAWVVYWLLMRIKGTRAAQMALGLLILVLAWRLASLLELATVSFLLDNFLSSGLLILIVIFQSDIRRALTRVGRGAVRARPAPRRRTRSRRSCAPVRRSRSAASGALVAIERDVQLDEFVEQGTPLDAELIARPPDLDLPAVLAAARRRGRGAARPRSRTPGCILPLAMRANLHSALGTRHRAAIGITEETDALVVVVSEETGKISLVAGGEIPRTSTARTCARRCSS